MQQNTSLPVIGITTATVTFDGLERTFANEGYAQSIRNAGGIPILLPQQGGDALIAAILPTLHGIVFTGGQDIEPQLYHEEREPHTQASDIERDMFELHLYKAAKARNIPVLGICRGAQLINAAHGGTLIQDIATNAPGSLPHSQPKTSPRDGRVHDVVIMPETTLAFACKQTHFQTNSFHHQSVKRIGEGLRVSAHAPDGIIEAFESTYGPWLLAVQWHPEGFWKDADCADQKIFKAFVAACIDYARE